MADLMVLAQPAVNDLLQAEEDQLYEELAIRVQAVRDDPSEAGTFSSAATYNAEVMGPLDALQDFGRHFFDRLNTNAYGLACGTGAEDTEERQRFLSAFNIGIDTVAAALAALLVANLGIAPVIAAVVAAIIIKLFFRATYQAMCDTWQGRLPQQAT